MHTHTDTHTHIRSCDRDSKFSAKRNKTKGRLQMADTRHQSTWEPGLGRSHSQRQRQRQRQSQSHCHQTGNEPDEHETRKLSSSNHYSCGVRVGWSSAGEGKGRKGKRLEDSEKRSLEPNCSFRTWSQRTYRAADELHYLTSLTTDQPSDQPTVRPPDHRTGLQFARSIAVKTVLAL